jgi:hypothetical protein
MSNTTTGWVVFIGALGMMMGLMAMDISNIKTWDVIFTPAFIGSSMAHFSTVIAAFIAGKLIPTERNSDLRSRTSDSPPTIIVKTDVGEKK